MLKNITKYEKCIKIHLYCRNFFYGNKFLLICDIDWFLISLFHNKEQYKYFVWDFIDECYKKGLMKFNPKQILLLLLYDIKHIKVINIFCDFSLFKV